MCKNSNKRFCLDFVWEYFLWFNFVCYGIYCVILWLGYLYGIIKWIPLDSKRIPPQGCSGARYFYTNTFLTKFIVSFLSKITPKISIKNNTHHTITHQHYITPHLPLIHITHTHTTTLTHFTHTSHTTFYTKYTHTFFLQLFLTIVRIYVFFHFSHHNTFQDTHKYRKK